MSHATERPHRRASALALLVFALLTFAAAAFGASFRPGEWYVALEKPPWNPPAWVFGPAWTTLYIAMTIAAFLVWRRGARGENRATTRSALAWWLVQLVLNALWSWLFFGLHRPVLALFEMALLWIAIAVTARAFGRAVPLAGWLLVPYLAWVTYAFTLNAAIAWLNR